MKWDTWSGKRVQSQRGDVYIETGIADWKLRLAAWKASLYDDSTPERNPCPCPMPEGHIMFNMGTALGRMYKPHGGRFHDSVKDILENII